MRFLRHPVSGCLAIFLLAGSVAQAGPIPRETTRIVLKQGELIYLPVQVGPGAVDLEGRVGERVVRIFETGQGQFGMLLGADLEEPPGRRTLKVTIRYAGGRQEERRYDVQVRDAAFGVQEMTLPQDQVDLDKEAETRALREQERVMAILTQETPRRLWKGNFLLPVDGGEIAGAFGLRRILNGQPRRPHSGEDIRAPLGTEVHAANAGVVRLSDDLFFSGTSIILDHGLGVYTMYFHLVKAGVKAGDRVERGQVIGTVGATGRATGPHLHWGLRVGGARVNPMAITRVALE